MITDQRDHAEVANNITTIKPMDLYTVSGLHPLTQYSFTVATGDRCGSAYLVSPCPTDNCFTLEDGKLAHCVMAVLILIFAVRVLCKIFAGF